MCDTGPRFRWRLVATLIVVLAAWGVTAPPVVAGNRLNPPADLLVVVHDERTIQRFWNGPSGPGRIRWEVTVIVDADQEFAEDNETNNVPAIPVNCAG